MLAADNYAVTSKQTRMVKKKYNCIAWTFGKKNKWWEPADYPGYYWPKGVPRDGSTKAAIKLYEKFRFKICASIAKEDGFEKVAIYYDDDDYTHVALQLPDGKWTSKLGDFEDISHESLDALCGGSKDEYGKVFCIMKRKRHE